jgi:hypothetical protein
VDVDTDRGYATSIDNKAGEVVICRMMFKLGMNIKMSTMETQTIVETHALLFVLPAQTECIRLSQAQLFTHNFVYLFKAVLFQTDVV